MRLFFSLLGLAGVAMLSGTVWMVDNTREFLANAEVAEGTVVAIKSRDYGDRTYYPVIRFKPFGNPQIEFEGDSTEERPAYERGDSVTVLYDPANPEKALIKSFMSLWLGPIATGILGTLFSAICCFHWLETFDAWRRRVWLDRHGRRVNAQVVSIDSYPLQKKWRIKAQWKDLRGEVHSFEGEHFEIDPTPYLAAGKSVLLLIDPENPELRYRFDLSFLPKDA